MDYVLSAGKVYIGTGAGERYVGASPALSFSLDVTTKLTMKSERGVVVPDKSHLISATGGLTLDLESISQDNLSMYFGSSGDWIEYLPRKIVQTLAVRRGYLYPLAEGGFIRTRAYIGDREIGVPENFHIDGGFGVVEARSDAPDLMGAPDVRFETECGRSVSQEIGITAKLVTGSLRYVEQNAYGSNRMFFFPEATFRPDSAIDFKDANWRKLSIAAEVTSVPRVIEQNRRDDYGVGSPTVKRDFGTAPFQYNDDYGVFDGR